jgi:hypothetical protein
MCACRPRPQAAGAPAAGDVRRGGRSGKPIDDPPRHRHAPTSAPASQSSRNGSLPVHTRIKFIDRSPSGPHHAASRRSSLDRPSARACFGCSAPAGMASSRSRGRTLLLASPPAGRPCPRPASPSHRRRRGRPRCGAAGCWPANRACRGNAQTNCPCGPRPSLGHRRRNTRRTQAPPTFDRPARTRRAFLHERKRRCARANPGKAVARENYETNPAKSLENNETDPENEPTTGGHRPRRRPECGGRPR